jgi:hypothetical protein
VTVDRAILRGLVSNDVLFRDRDTRAWTVSADDIVTRIGLGEPECVEDHRSVRSD